MDIITGQTKPDNGHILWGEKSIDLIRKTESEIALLGICLLYTSDAADD